MKDIESVQDIALLVDTFYGRVQQDDLLSFAFNTVAQLDWETHLPRMVEFWETIIFRKKGYKGNPAYTHMLLASKMAQTDHHLTPDHFTHWVTLFGETVDSLFCGENADFAKQSAAQMGRGLSMNIFGRAELFIPSLQNREPNS